MKIRDNLAEVNGDKRTVDFPNNGIDIICDSSDRTLFAIHLEADGSLLITAGAFCKQNGKLVEDRLMVIPVASNFIRVIRPDYKKPKLKKLSVKADIRRANGL